MIELGKGRLDPQGAAQRVSDITIRAPGVRGRFAVYKPSPGESRGKALASDILGEALERTDVATDFVIEFDETRKVDIGAAVKTRSTPSDHRGIEIELPAASDKFRQMLLVTDDNGIATWHLPEPNEGTATATRARGAVTFVIPAYSVQRPADSPKRGIFGYLGKKIVRALIFALIDKVIGEVAEHFAGTWEDKYRPYGLRSFKPQNHRQALATDLGDDDWQRLQTGPALLFVHGTFSRAHTAFYNLPGDLLGELHDRYSGRVFAFDHPTLAQNPTENAAWFVDHLPQVQTLDIDIVCHSRGGLVSRVLAEEQDRLPMNDRRVNVRQVIFVASPNAGTVLTEPKFMGDFVDAQTNILGLLPDNLITDTLEIIITALKQLAVGALNGLDGLQSMNPKGSYLNQMLNSGAMVDTVYRAIAADFEPTDNKLAPWAKDRLMDKIFREPNDLVVPTRGVYEANNDSMFPLEPAALLKLPPSEGVHHGSYFGNAKTVATMRAWLTG